MSQTDEQGGMMKEPGLIQSVVVEAPGRLKVLLAGDVNPRLEGEHRDDPAVFRVLRRVEGQPVLGPVIGDEYKPTTVATMLRQFLSQVPEGCVIIVAEVVGD